MNFISRFVQRWWPALIVLTAAGVGALAAATVQMGNADQLVNGFLFESIPTFTGATFPLEHTQLLKWPLFVALSLGHFARFWYIGLTVVAALGTIMGFLYLLRIIGIQTEKYYVLCILFVSVGLLIPVQVFDGGVSAPLGLSMLTGRNIEYLVFLGALGLYLKSDRWRSWQWVCGTVLLSVLFASDQLFVMLGLVGAVLFGVIVLVIRPTYQWLSRRWLAGSVAAWLLCQGWFFVISHFTHVTAYPLGNQLIHGLPGMWLAITGTLQASALTFGITTRAGMWSFPTLALNIITVGLIIYATIWVLRQLSSPTKPSRALLFAAMCLATSAVALGGYVIINHPYVQDARYLTICMFTGFVVLAVWLRTVRLPHPKFIIIIGISAVVLAAFASVQHNRGLVAHDPLAARNKKIVHVLASHHVDFLVGNYWRLMPIHALTPDQKISPLQGCLRNAPVLSSATWRPELLKRSFAYLLTIQSSGVPQAQCHERHIIQQFGTPSVEVIIAGNQGMPREVLLFYDEGAAARRPR